MSRLTRDGTAGPVSRDQILRHARGQGNTIFPVQLTTSRIGNLTRLIHTLLYVMTIHTYIHTFRKRCGRCSQVAGVSVESTEHIMRVHATQGVMPLAWLPQWGRYLPHFVYSVLCVDPSFFGVVVD